MDFPLPELGEGVYEAELTQWLVKPGDAVKHGQSLMEVMTDKATMEVPAPFSGTIDSLQADPGKTIKVGDVVLSFTPSGGEKSDTAKGRRGEGATPAGMPLQPHGDGAQTVPASPGRRVAASSPGVQTSVKAAPSVRLMARKLGVDLSQIRGSGPEGRILVNDLAVPGPAAAKTQATREPRQDYGKPGTRIKLQGIRRKIAERMVLAKRTIPHYSYVDECDVTELTRIRLALREPFANRGIHLTYLAFIVKAVAQALKEVPVVNATLDDKQEEIVLHDTYHVGIAVAAPTGLIVPVIHDADRKEIGKIAADIDRLSGEARQGKLRLEDLRGGTFTVTSIGGIGGLISTPVINHPQAGILAIGKVVKRPVYDAAGNIRPADMLYLSFSFDHRVIDGAIGAVFGNAIIERLQNPAALLLPDSWNDKP